MIAYACHSPGVEVSIHDTEEAAERAAARMQRDLEYEDRYQRRLGRISMVVPVAVWFQVVIEPEVRAAGYWDRAQRSAA